MANRPQRRTLVLESQTEAYADLLAIREALHDVVLDLVKVYARAGHASTQLLDANRLLSDVPDPGEVVAA